MYVSTQTPSYLNLLGSGKNARIHRQDSRLKDLNAGDKVEGIDQMTKYGLCLPSTITVATRLSWVILVEMKEVVKLSQNRSAGVFSPGIASLLSIFRKPLSPRIWRLPWLVISTPAWECYAYVQCDRSARNANVWYGCSCECLDTSRGCGASRAAKLES